MDADRLDRIAAVLRAMDGTPSLDRLLEAGIDMLPITGAGIAIVGDGHHRGSLAVVGSGVAAVDELQFSLGEGPCIGADRSDGPLLEPVLDQACGLWPAFAPAAIALGVNAVFAFPLRVGAVNLGVLTLYRSTPGDLEPSDLADALAFAHVTTHLLMEIEGHLVPGSLPDRLDEVFDQRAHVHQATGMIAAQLESDVATALARLRAFAWASDRTIGDAALEVVARRLRFGDEP